MSDRGELVGRVDEIDRRIDRISARIDTHISNCTVRFFFLLGAISAATAVLAFVIHSHGAN